MTNKTTESVKSTAGSGVAKPPSAKPKQSKKLVIVGIVSALVVVVTASVMSYAFWYNKPNKMLADGIVGLTKSTGASGNVEMSGDDQKIRFEFDSANGKDANKADIKLIIEQGSSDLNFKVETIATHEGTAYVKLTDVDKTIDAFVDSAVSSAEDSLRSAGQIPTPEMSDQIKTSIRMMLSGVTNKIKNKWIKLTPDDLSSSGNNESSQCFVQVMKSLSSDKDAVKSLTRIFRKHQFILVDESVKLEDKDGSKGMRVKFDKDAAERFSEAAKDLPLAKDLIECGKNIYSDQSSNNSSEVASSLPKGELNVWVDKVSHKITSVGASVDTSDDSKVTDGESTIQTKSRMQKVNIDFMLSYDSSADITLPGDGDIIKASELEDVVKGIFPGMASLDGSGVDITEEDVIIDEEMDT